MYLYTVTEQFMITSVHFIANYMHIINYEVS